MTNGVEQHFDALGELSLRKTQPLADSACEAGRIMTGVLFIHRLLMVDLLFGSDIHLGEVHPAGVGMGGERVNVDAYGLDSVCVLVGWLYEPKSGGWL